MVSASLLLPSPLGVDGELCQQAQEQVPQQHNQRPGAARDEPKTHLFPDDGKTLGRVGGVGFHVC
jgi:hypothetical protein